MKIQKLAKNSYTLMAVNRPLSFRIAPLSLIWKWSGLVLHIFILSQVHHISKYKHGVHSQLFATLETQFAIDIIMFECN